MDTESWTRSPKSSKDGHGVRKAVKMDIGSWMRSPKSSKMDTGSWTRSPKSSKDGHGILDTKSGKQNGLITVFTGDAVACECCHSEAGLWVGLTLGTKTHLVSVESKDCTWLSRRDEHHFLLVV
ncbi:hypothetical protein CDL15_Pgr000211 [Punica granatum]|uniref:Uncharacterized protein n=1 Tax=Punica granatum TaxID=22663 RepID=A0A218Y1U1_PUNGR|nr:hypothetical protein CDL15_Pgr000211 [Punica granatum]